jgi:hypothetical protein
MQTGTVPASPNPPLATFNAYLHLIAKAAAHRASYEWQYSTDPKTWTVLPVTVQAKTDVVGLTVGTTYSFRVRPVTLTGEGNWTQVVSLNVS